MPKSTERPYTTYRSRRLPFGGKLPLPKSAKTASKRRRPTLRNLRRKWWKLLLGAIVGWILLSFVVFLASASLSKQQLASSGQAPLAPGGFPLTTPNNILVLGSDARGAGTKEPGVNPGDPGRSDAILLLRIGPGQSTRLSIPRDTVANIPGHGKDKINAAYAIGGPGLSVLTLEQFLGITINHVVEINFENFPALVDSVGGISYRGGCVISRINGGAKNGGYTLRLTAGKHRVNGKQALALARTRHNDCNIRENDLSRARRQQKIFTALKHRLLSPATFFRLPWVSWHAPRALKTDMGPFSLLGAALAVFTPGKEQTRVLRPAGPVLLPNDGDGLLVSDSERIAAAKLFR